MSEACYKHFITHFLQFDINYVYNEKYANEFLYGMDEFDFSYVEYVTERIREHYLLDFAWGTADKWRLGVFLMKSKAELESSWLSGLIGQKDEELLVLPLDSCQVCHGIFTFCLQ